MPQGSLFWQAVLFFLALLFLAWETWRGWRRGVIRSGINLAAFVVSSFVGTIAAQWVAKPLGGMGELSGLIPGVLVGLVLGFATMVAIWLFGAIAFKRTEHQGSGMIKVLWGGGGAFFGFAQGVILLLGAVIIVRMLGALGESRVASAQAVRAVDPNSPRAHSPAVANQLATLKQSLEMGPAGKVVESVDIIPTDAYELFGGVNRVINDPATMARFIEYPGIQELMKSPKLSALLNDPSVMKAAQERDFLSMMNSKALRAAVDDPDLGTQLRKIDLKAALKFALETPTPSPAPSHHSKSK